MGSVFSYALLAYISKERDRKKITKKKYSKDEGDTILN